MQECAVIESDGLGASARSFLEGHRTIVFILFLTAIFLYGWFEGAVYNQRDWACASWILGLLMLAAWIVYPGTTVRICLGVVVFVSGAWLMIVYYRGRPPRT